MPAPLVQTLRWLRTARCAEVLALLVMLTVLTSLGLVLMTAPVLTDCVKHAVALLELTVLSGVGERRREHPHVVLLLALT